jgi:hypothetical protein
MGMIDQQTKIKLTSQFFSEFGHGNATKQFQMAIKGGQ